MSADPTREGHVTTDRETIRRWADERNAVPVRTGGTGRDADRVMLVEETEVTGTDERMDWDAFFDDLRTSDMVVIYHEDLDREPFDVVHHDEALTRSDLGESDIERALSEGETVTGTITETTVVETTVVERADVESELVDTELVDDRIGNAELLSREAVGTELVDEADADNREWFDADRYRESFAGEAGIESFEVEGEMFPYHVEIEVEEVWDVTRELLERLTVETRVVDVDVEEMDTIEAQDIDVEGIQQSIIEGDLFEGDATIESRHVDSEFAGDDVVHTYLHRWTTVEDEVVDRKLLVADVTDVENYEMEVAESLPVETRYTEEDTIAAMSEGTTAEATTGEPMAEGTTTEGTTGEPMAEGTTGEPMAEGTTGEPMAEVTSGEPAAQAPTITQDDEGKDVVDAAGEKIGMIDEVEASTAYVDPNPSLTDRIKAALDWGDVDEGDYPLPAEQISEITDDEVRLREGPDLGT